MDTSTLFPFLDNLQTEMLQTLEELTNLESPSTEKQHTDRLAAHLQQRFSRLGARSMLLSNPAYGNHVEVRWSAGPSDAKPALLLCHLDTVWASGTLASRSFQVRDDKAWGPGVYDMKGGIVLAEFALRALAELGLTLPRPIILLITSDEEIGSPTSRSIIEEHAHQAEYVLVLEPSLPGGIIKTARKGVGQFDVAIQGIAAHAGADPEKGASAIQELAHQILRLHGLTDLALGTTVNVGIVSGGTRSNVVAAEARAQVDVRVWTLDEARRIEALIRDCPSRTPETRVQVTGGFNRPPMERTAAGVALFEQTRAIAARLGIDLQEGAAGGASDGNFTAALGIPTLDGLGVVGDGAHAVHEHVCVDSLPQRAALLAALLLHL
jgi:glutamate carboxypeptidase